MPCVSPVGGVGTSAVNNIDFWLLANANANDAFTNFNITMYLIYFMKRLCVTNRCLR